MQKQPPSLNPDLSQVASRLYTDRQFYLAAKENPEQALAEYTLDDAGRQALQLLLANFDDLPDAIEALPPGGFSRCMRSRTIARRLTEHL